MLWKKGRLGEAADAFRRAVALKPDYAEAHSGLGVILWKQRRLGEAVPVLRRACTLQPDSAYAHCNLGSALLDARRFDEAIPVLRRAVRLKPSLPAAHFNLGYALKARGRFPEAAAAYRRAIALEPAWAQAHCNLGNALLRQGRTDEALAAYSRALGLKPDLVEGYPNLALALSRKGQIDEAVAALRKAIALKPDWATPHYDLGNALVKQGRREEAAVAYRQAIALKPDYAEAYCNLGSLLRRRGEYAQALTAFKRGHELGSQRKDWQSPSARWVEECRHLVELDGRAQSVLQGKAQPGSARERNEFAQLCYHKGHHAAAARFWADAFTAYPGLAADLDAGHRYDAACAAALAAAGQGADASRLDDRERARWRKQAVEWLRADLALRARRLKAGAPEERGEMAWRLRYWQQDSELASLRDPAAVARLPADERAACNQLWAEVAVLLRQADAAQQPDHRPE